MRRAKRHHKAKAAPAHDYGLLPGKSGVERLLVAELLEQFVDGPEF
jgi:hypothetical protein